MKLHEKLYSLRKEKGITQAELAEKLDVSRQSISNWEVGSITPSIGRLKALSDLYNVPLDYLLDEDEEDCPSINQNHVASEDKSTSADLPTETSHKNSRWKRIVLILVLAGLLIVLTVFLTIHISRRDKDTDGRISFDDMSQGEIEFSSGTDFDFN